VDFAERLIERHAPWNTGPVIASRTDLERYLRALAAMFEPVEALAAEVGSDGEPGYVPAWGTLLDVETAPADALPYLATYVGVQLPNGVGEVEARTLIKEEAGFQRGTRSALEAALTRVLGIGVPFTIEERTNVKGEEDAYYFLVIVAPGKSSNALLEAINAVKPAGVFYSVVEVEAPWVAALDTWEAVSSTVTWESVKEGEV